MVGFPKKSSQCTFVVACLPFADLQAFPEVVESAVSSNFNAIEHCQCDQIKMVKLSSSVREGLQQHGFLLPHLLG